MLRSSLRAIVRASALAVCAMASLPSLPQATGGSPVPRSIYPGDAIVAGRSLKEWSAEWAQYVFSQNVAPLTDTTGAACRTAQHGPVWFLAGTSGGSASRSCLIPEGKALMVPLLNLLDVNTAAQPAAELRAEIAGCLDNPAELYLAIDGVAVSAKVLNGLRVKSIAFDVVYPDLGAGVFSPAVSDGYYAMIAPLAVGTHTIQFGGTSNGCQYPATGFYVAPWSTATTYQITVAPVSLR